MNHNNEQVLALAGAALLHLLLLGLLLFQWPERKPEPAASAAAEPVIQARAVSEDEVLAPLRARQAAEEAERRRIAAARQAAEERRQAEQRRVEEQRRTEQQRQAEQRRQAEAKRQAEAEAEAKRQAEAEAKRQAEAEAKRQAEAEAKRQAEAEAKRQAEEEARRKAEVEARRQAEAEAKRQAEEALRQQMAAEQRRLDAEAQRQRQAQLDRLQNEYVLQISDKVRRNWLRPDGSRGTLCTVLITQLPDGEVVRVQATRCDGDAAFQRSVENAVLRSSPLPLPADRALFSREIQFNFRP
ncbi:MAG: cell envelope integrity protein TolA [Thiohalomonadaceae bacterium]